MIDPDHTDDHTDDDAAAEVARERLAMALDDAREAVELRTKDIRRCLERGLAWSHETVRRNRAILGAALADMQVLELITRDK
jgi:hypothetical protein